MKKRVYVETTVVSYLTARSSRDLIRAARQELTREWWERRRENFGLFASQLVLEESGAGDAEAAKRRLEALQDVSLLDMRREVGELAVALIEDGPLPPAAGGDSIHLALAAVYDVDFLLTWNCRHLANAELSGPVADFLRARGYRPPIVCTPEELMGE